MAIFGFDMQISDVQKYVAILVLTAIGVGAGAGYLFATFVGYVVIFAKGQISDSQSSALLFVSFTPPFLMSLYKGTVEIVRTIRIVRDEKEKSGRELPR